MLSQFRFAFELLDRFAIEQLRGRGEMQGVLLAQRGNEAAFMPLPLLDDHNQELQQLAMAKVALDEFGATSYCLAYAAMMQTRTRVIGRRGGGEERREESEVVAIIAVDGSGRWWLRTRAVGRTPDRAFSGLAEPELVGPRPTEQGESMARLLEEGPWDIPEGYRRAVREKALLRPLGAMEGR